jgi:hypothetical protein
MGAGEMNQDNWDKDDMDQEDTVACPHCRNNYTHHTTVIVQDRHEDGPIHTITIPHHSIEEEQISHELKDIAISPRRHAFGARFWCETCHGTFEVWLFQHKGQTFFRVRRLTEKVAFGPSVVK